MRNIFFEAIVKFEQCAMHNAVPVTFCVECLGFYVDNVRSFQNLSSISDPNMIRERCVDRYMNQDAYNVIWQQYDSSRNLWNNAACTSE